jgi:hypothetical protein
MSSILSLDGGQLGGLRAVFFVPVAALRLVPDTDAGGLALLGDLVLAPGANWDQLQGTIYTPALDVDAVATVHGPGYDHELGGFFAGDAPAVAAQFLAMQGRRFVVLYRDFDGITRLVGDQRGGLEFSYKLTTGTKPGERKGYKWTFRGRTASPAKFYAGLMPAALPSAPPSAPAYVDFVTTSGRLLARVPVGYRIVVSGGIKLTYQIKKI